MEGPVPTDLDKYLPSVVVLFSAYWLGNMYIFDYVFGQCFPSNDDCCTSAPNQSILGRSGMLSLGQPSGLAAPQHRRLRSYIVRLVFIESI